MKAAFLPTVSTQITCTPGFNAAITTPGRPPPLPTSRIRRHGGRVEVPTQGADHREAVGQMLRQHLRRVAHRRQVVGGVPALQQREVGQQRVELRFGQIERQRVADLGQCGALDLTEPQLDTLLTYLALLQRWNATYNLTVRDRADVGAASGRLPRGNRPHLRRRFPTTPCRRSGRRQRRWSAWHREHLRPGVQAICVDTVGKKAAFIRQAAGELALNLAAEHARVEQLKAAPFDVSRLCLAGRFHAPDASTSCVLDGDERQDARR